MQGGSRVYRIILCLLCVLSCTMYSLDWPHTQMSRAILMPPSAAHWLGTNALGEDVLLQVLKALPNTLFIAICCGVIPLILGLILAAISVFSVEYIDRLLLKFTDVFLLIPSLLPLMLFATLLEPGLWMLIFLLCLLSWVDDFKVFRTAIHKIKATDAVLNARHHGASNSYILKHYILPTVLPMMSVLFLQNAHRAIMMSAGLSFLGLTDPRLLSWGSLLMEAQDYIHADAFWWLIPGPVVSISLLIFLFNALHTKEQ